MRANGLEYSRAELVKGGQAPFPITNHLRSRLQADLWPIFLLLNLR